MKGKVIRWKALISSFLIVYGVAAIGSLFTNVGPWYESIKPSITPPNWVFPVVWNILFFLIAISLYYAWTNSNRKQKMNISLVYGLNFGLNILWSALYFGLRNPGYAFFEIILLWTSIVLMISYSSKVSKTAAWLLVPYLLWVSFATILNYLSI